MNYHHYLQLDSILSAQQPESAAHDETLFIITHQAYELWFKQILWELDSVIEHLSAPALNDNSPVLQTIVHRLDRTVEIFKLCVQQIGIMETMTAMDFLDFRDLLRPASGFQSVQFKTIEAKLGLTFSERHGGHYYTSQLCPAHIDAIKQTESTPSVLVLINAWLERMPRFVDEGFWNNYVTLFNDSLGEGEKQSAHVLKNLLMQGNGLSAQAVRSALFIFLYRGYPMLHLPFRLLNTLLEIDEQLSIWRFRHMHMVSRIIGSRQGTGGSTGANYLKGALEKHNIFRPVAELNGFLLPTQKLPAIPANIEQRLGYHQ